MFGDVRIYYGQSNKELLTLWENPIYQSEIESSPNNNICCFTVLLKYNFKQESCLFKTKDGKQQILNQYKISLQLLPVLQET